MKAGENAERFIAAGDAALQPAQSASIGPASGSDLSREVYGILGIPVDAVDDEDVFRLIEAAAESRTPFLLSTPNLNFLIKSRSDPGFRNSLLLSDLCPADGMPIVWLGRLLGVPLRKRVSGADIFDGLKSRTSPSRRLKVFLFGGVEGVAAKLSSLLNARSAGMQCVGSMSPGFGTVEQMSSEEIIDRINSTKADFLAVFLTAAKGQAWLLLNHRRLKIPVRAHLGATINFQAGMIRRAPVFLQRLGLEWAWRIKEEPYLWKRYWGDIRQFAGLFATAALPLAMILLRSRWRKANGRPLQVVARTETRDHLNLRLAGAATAEFASTAISEFSEISEFHTSVTLDLSEVSIVDARFIGILLMLRKQIHKRDGSLKLAGISPEILAIFRLNGFEFLLDPASTA